MFFPCCPGKDLSQNLDMFTDFCSKNLYKNHLEVDSISQRIMFIQNTEKSKQYLFQIFNRHSLAFFSVRICDYSSLYLNKKDLLFINFCVSLVPFLNTSSMPHLDRAQRRRNNA